MRNARAQREPIWLQSEGEGDLAMIARELHRVLFSAQAPFVMCDTRRQAGSSNARSPANEDTLGKAIAAAKGGTLCVRSHRLPHGFAPSCSGYGRRRTSLPSELAAYLAERFPKGSPHARQESKETADPSMVATVTAIGATTGIGRAPDSPGRRPGPLTRWLASLGRR